MANKKSFVARAKFSQSTHEPVGDVDYSQATAYDADSSNNEHSQSVTGDASPGKIPEPEFKPENNQDITGFNNDDYSPDNSKPQNSQIETNNVKNNDYQQNNMSDITNADAGDSYSPSSNVVNNNTGDRTNSDNVPSNSSDTWTPSPVVNPYDSGIPTNNVPDNSQNQHQMPMPDISTVTNSAVDNKNSDRTASDNVANSKSDWNPESVPDQQQNEPNQEFNNNNDSAAVANAGIAYSSTQVSDKSFIEKYFPDTGDFYVYNENGAIQQVKDKDSIFKRRHIKKTLTSHKHFFNESFVSQEAKSKEIAAKLSQLDQPMNFCQRLEKRLKNMNL